ncbi:MAG: mechanosensitive ion channel family protein [Acidobacteria bacterium]|nr:mechanosensitive ion channel family protein [Acidobacteriota bacterium]
MAYSFIRVTGRLEGTDGEVSDGALEAQATGVAQMATHDRDHPRVVTAASPISERQWAAARGLRSCVGAIILLVVLIAGAGATPQNGVGQGPTTPATLHELLALLADPKAHQLLTLLADPKTQQWLEMQTEAKTAQNAPSGPVQLAADPAGDNFENRFGNIQLGEQGGQGGAFNPTLQGPLFHEAGLSAGAGAIHDQIVALARAIPALPAEFERAGARLTAVHGKYDGAGVLMKVAVFLVFGFGAQWLFERATRGFRRRLDLFGTETVMNRLRLFGARSVLAFGVIVAFTLGCLGPFFAFSWDPASRETILFFLIAFVFVRIAATVGGLLLAPASERLRIIPMGSAAARFWHRRLVLFAASFALLCATILECSALGFSFDGLQLVGYALGLIVLAVALEAVWRRPITPREVAEASRAEARHFGRGATNIAVSIGLVLLWGCWVAAPGVMSVDPGFWLILVIITLPLAIGISRRTVEHLLEPSGSSLVGGPPNVIAVTLEHGIRAVLIIGAVVVLGWAWDVDLVHLTGRDTFARIVHGALTTVVILLIADVLWNAARAAIDCKLAETDIIGLPNSEEARRRARLRTLLPIFRNVLFILVISVAVMMVLAELGVEIGPLIAGASVVGVAIGFGAQTFVRDVIAGMFYLLDDAFRVGEYIQAGHYKGTVEGFSIRSIKLRHHRGPVFTVPFSLLGAVENMSRDWVIDKIAIGVTYDSDLALAKKLIKQIGLDLAKDPEFAPLIMEPLKMQGVDALGDFAVQIRAKMMTVPGEQFMIRRQAYAMIKQAFDANGIKFAFPTVQIAGEGEAASAAVAQRALELVPPAAV